MEEKQHFEYLTEEGLKTFLKNIKKYYRENTKPDVVKVADQLSTPRQVWIKALNKKGRTEEIGSFSFDGSENFEILLKLGDFSRVDHTHVISNVENLQSTLDEITRLVLEEVDRATNAEIEEAAVRKVQDAALDARVVVLENKEYGKIDDVRVDGETVVVDKIADISTEKLVKKTQIGFDVPPLIEGKIPNNYLPPTESSNFKDVETVTELPIPGERGIIYFVRNENNYYKWNFDKEKYESLGSSEDISPAVEQLQGEMQEAQNSIGVLNAGLSQERSDREESITSLAAQTQDSLDLKINYTDVKNDLVSPDTDKPLSAAMGGELKDEIDDLGNEIRRIPQPFKFRGTVSSEEELPSTAETGDVYQIISEDETKNGVMYAWDGNQWLQIAASAVDITAYMSTVAEVNEIINKYI